MSRIVMCITWTLLGVCSVTHAHDVAFFGTTTSLYDRDENDKPLDVATYVPQKDVAISILRSTPPLAKALSNSLGRFGDLDQNKKPTLTIKPGLPVNLLFDGPEELVPEMQQLSAEEGKYHVVHVTLLSVSQYREIYGNDALVKKLEYIIEILERCDGEDVKRQRERMQARLKRWRG